MPPKFQSSFIPKSPVSGVPAMQAGARARQRDLGSFIAKAIFVLSIILAGGVFLYKLYLDYGITRMGESLESARSALAPETVEELIALSGRIASTKDLIGKHRVLTPVFDFLESSTPQSVRFSEFAYSSTEKGLELVLRGEARGYSALALVSDVINKNASFKDPVFSDLSLDSSGNVVFSVQMHVEPEFLSYRRSIEGLSLPAQAIPVPSATSTSTTTPVTATSTNP